MKNELIKQKSVEDSLVAKQKSTEENITRLNKKVKELDDLNSQLKRD
jgi:hypothetical protein